MTCQQTYCQLPPLPQLPGQGHDQFPPFNPERWYTSAEAAQLLHTTSRGVQNFIKRGQLKASRVGKRWLISARNVEAFIKAMEQNIKVAK